MKKNDNKNNKKKKSTTKKSPDRKKPSMATVQTAEDCTKEEKGNTKIELTEEGSTVNIDRALARAKQSTSTFKKPDEPVKKESAIQPKGQSKDAKKTSNAKAKPRTTKSEPAAEDVKTKTKTSTINSQTSINSNSSGNSVPVVDHTGNTVIEEQDGSGPADARCKKSIKDWAMGVIKRGVDPILQEYKSLASTVPADRYKLWSENSEFNRYHNTYCLDSTRVKVGSNEKTGYIHANYVGLEDHSKKFICAQGPMDITVDRFWQMIVSEGAEFVVMLCDPIENKKEKCFKYWPSEVAEKLTFGGVTVTNNGSLELETAKPIQVTVSLLNVKFGDRGYLIRHFHWKGWPDHGVPKSFLAITKLLSAIKTTTKPVVVHCSAGVGRTGTLVLISLAQARLLRDGFPGILETLIKFREQRAQVVQNEMQYLYVYRCLIEYYVEKRCLPKKAAEKFFRDYDAYFTAADQKRKKKKDTTKEMDAAS